MKKRLDVILMERNLFPSREKARTAIMTGRILIHGNKETKAGTMIAEDTEIEVIGHDLPYVSRGGLKLEKAVKAFELDFKDKTVLDIGASTGGLPIALSRTARKKYTPLMWATVSWPGLFGATAAWWYWKKSTPAI